METNKIIDGSQHFPDSEKTSLSGDFKAAIDLGYDSFPTQNHADRFLNLTPGVKLLSFKWISTDDIELKQLSKQSRSKGVCSANKQQVKNQIVEEGQKYPVYCTVDPVSGKLMLEHGHHRYYACREEGLLIAAWIIEFGSREDGLDARAEFNQFQNKKEAHKGHDKDDALHYLNSVKYLSGYFTELYKIKDELEKAKGDLLPKSF